LLYELTAGQVGTGFAWKVYICCAAATPVSGTRVASGLPGTPKGVKVFFNTKHFSTEFAEQSFLSWYFEYTGYRLPMIYNANVNFLNASGATAGGAYPIMVHFADNKLFNINEGHPHWHYMCHRYHTSFQEHSHIFVDPV